MGAEDGQPLTLDSFSGFAVDLALLALDSLNVSVKEDYDLIPALTAAALDYSSGTLTFI